MTGQTTSRSTSMNTSSSNFICFDRRKNLRRAPRGLRSLTTLYEPNPFSRRAGIDRRDSVVVYRTRRQAS